MSVPHALLALLSEGPKYGLRLQNEFESRTGEVWPLNVGQVYTTLQRLERDGLVETDDREGERSRKRYRITAAGDRALADWLRTPPDLEPPPRDELVIKVLVALQVPGTDVHEILQVHRRHVIEVMQRYTRVKAAAGEDDVALALVADAELFRLEAIVRWLDAADVRLKQRPSLTPAAVADLSVRTITREGGLPMTSALELRQVSKVYGSGPTEVRALHEVDLSVERGELVAIMGPSGSGKSTLLTIAGSLEQATSGQVLVDGVDLATVSRSEQAQMRRRSIGYVFQDFNLIPGLTAVENVTLPLELDGTRAKTARAAGLEAMEELDVAGLADRYPDELSGGERQRAAIARAIVGDRGLLLADEPTGALDSVNGEAVMRLLRAATKRGIAGVVVTHEAQLASWADRVVFLRDGHVVDQTVAPPGPESLLAAGDR